jgi:methylase of polypeptide subunit release factors
VSRLYPLIGFRRSLKLFLSMCIRGYTAKTFLDVGCGDGEITLVIAKALKCNDIYGVDISPEAVRLASEKDVKAYQLDVEENDLSFK